MKRDNIALAIYILLTAIAVISVVYVLGGSNIKYKPQKWYENRLKSPRDADGALQCVI